MHVVVLGGGYAGVALTRALERRLPDEVAITLVDESPTHLVQHELHRVIRRPGLEREITIPLTDVVKRATVRVDRVKRIDREERLIRLSDGSLEYDICAICLGAETAYYGLEGVSEHAIPCKRIAHTTRIRSRFFSALEDGDPRVVVAGAGLSGIQVAGELGALAREEGEDVSITLLEQFDTVAPQFPGAFQQAVRRSLERAGVEVRTRTAVTGADESRVTLEGAEHPASIEELAYDLFVWTGGIRGPACLDGTRPTVRRDLRLDEHTFVAGDAARVIDADGTAVPASAQAAIREAKIVAKNVTRLVSAETGTFEPRLESFRFGSPGWLVSVGDDAVAQVGPATFTGAAAKALKATVGVGYLSSVGAIRNAAELVQLELDRERS